MADETENLSLVFLRRIDANVACLNDDMREVKERLGILETQQAQLHTQYASLSNRIDRVEVRLDRIERRLELAEPASP